MTSERRTVARDAASPQRSGIHADVDTVRLNAIRLALQKGDTIAAVVTSVRRYQKRSGSQDMDADLVNTLKHVEAVGPSESNDACCAEICLPQPRRNHFHKELTSKVTRD